MPRTSRTERGFTLVELAVVVVIIGILAAFAVPKFLNSVERSKAAEAYNYLSTIQTAQERFHARQGAYASSLDDLDVDLPGMEYFESSGIDESDPQTLQTEWSMTLTRKGASAGFGSYTVVFNQDGFDKQTSTITEYPEINPMKTSTGD
ncbi:MAG: prepilin-type N-terminal cleavage/methylation domain-containing protein [Planctomycetota bacterium]|nr:prepilin-type N-terminal cleavage/methylation domain-containing protein [Planctomycetota bacterium]